MSLFDSSEIIKLPLQDAEIEYYPQFYGLEEANALFDALYQHTPWIEEDIRVYGKIYKQPRLTAFFANNQKTYGYSNISMTPQPFTPLLNAIKTKVGCGGANSKLRAHPVHLMGTGLWTGLGPASSGAASSGRLSLRSIVSSLGQPRANWASPFAEKDRT